MRRDAPSQCFVYDKATDVAYMRFSDARFTAEHLQEEFWLLKDADSGAISGIMIEDFARVFLQRYADLKVTRTEEHTASKRRSPRSSHQQVRRLGATDPVVRLESSPNRQ